MFQGRKSILNRRVRPAGLAAMAVMAFALLLPVDCRAQEAGPDISAFFSSIAGEWVGTCEQSADGKPADTKYFHALIKQADPCSFDSRFEIFRYDGQTNLPVKIGAASITTRLRSDGAAESKIVGKGVVMVDDKPKNEEHEYLEVVSCNDESGLTSRGSGTVSVSGMPLGLGKGGKIRDSRSKWTFENSVLKIDQTLEVEFGVLFLKKKFTVQARYAATRGSDVAALISNNRMRVSANPVSAEKEPLHKVSSGSPLSE